MTPETELPSEPILAGRADYRNRLTQEQEGVWLAPARGRVKSLTSNISEDEPRATRELRYALTHARCPVAVIPLVTYDGRFTTGVRSREDE